jgi:hypothetical protein
MKQVLGMIGVFLTPSILLYFGNWFVFWQVPNVANWTPEGRGLYLIGSTIFGFIAMVSYMTYRQAGAVSSRY